MTNERVIFFKRPKIVKTVRTTMELRLFIQQQPLAPGLKIIFADQTRWPRPKKILLGQVSFLTGQNICKKRLTDGIFPKTQYLRFTDEDPVVCSRGCVCDWLAGPASEFFGRSRSPFWPDNVRWPAVILEPSAPSYNYSDRNRIHKISDSTSWSALVHWSS